MILHLFKILLALTLIFSMENTIAQDSFDWQGHRGARGLVPENTIPSFLKALEYGVNTLEMDVAVSKDKKIIILSLIHI